MRVGRPFGLLPGILNSQLVPCVPWAPATPGQLALVAIAGAGGLGSATLLEAAGADSVRF